MLDIDGDTLGAALDTPERTQSLVADVPDADQVNAARARTAERCSPLTALVNNAGIASFRAIMDTVPEEWLRIMDINLTGPFLCARA